MKYYTNKFPILLLVFLLFSCEENKNISASNNVSTSHDLIIPKTIRLDQEKNINLDYYKLLINTEKYNDSFVVNIDGNIVFEITTHEQVGNEFHTNAWAKSFGHAENNEKFLSPAVFHDYDAYFIKYIDNEKEIYLLSDKDHSKLRGILFDYSFDSKFYQFSITINDSLNITIDEKIIALIELAFKHLNK